VTSLVGYFRHGLQSNYAFDGEVGLVPRISVLVYVYLIDWTLRSSQLTQGGLRSHP
jgi:hypothetical protein